MADTLSRPPKPSPHGDTALATSDGAAPAPNGGSTPPPSAPPAAAKRGFTAKKGGLLLVPLLLAGAAWYGYGWLTVGRFIVSTDDAYIKADNTTLAAKVSGYIVGEDAADNDMVRTGSVVVRIDDGDYRLAEQTARDNIAAQEATAERIGKQIHALNAAVEQAKAQLTSALAGATRAELELKRQKDLSTRDFASRQALEQAQAAHEQSAAAVVSAKAAITAAEANVDVSRAQQREAEGVLKQLRTALEKASRDLSFTTIRAPVDGVIGNRAAQQGDYVQPGQRIATLVPLDAVYIDANFKETQLGSIRTGQPVEIRVDAAPGEAFEGEVVSMAPASGSVFSLLPPDNATGNFTKVVQRLPVRIRIKSGGDKRGLLRPGMSVVVHINTKERGGPQIKVQ